MTSDAKIGLLLGLVFIFVIAFIINGLPGLRGTEDSNKLTTNMVGLQNNSSGLGAHQRKVALVEPIVSEPVVKGYTQAAESAVESTDTRFTMSLPQNAPVVERADKSQGTNVVVVPVESKPAVSGPTKSKPAFYVVADGDSLSSIAKKFYGDEQGNKLANIKAMYEANRRALAAMDDIRVGQKLVIPSLADLTSSSAGGVFKKVKSIGKRHLPAKAKSKSTSKALYTVREGDSLWRIADAQLGDGSRYKEIAKLNTAVLSDEDDLVVGMKLKLPVQ